MKKPVIYQFMTFLCLTFAVFSAKAEERPTAAIKVEYVMSSVGHSGAAGEEKVRTDIFILQLAATASYYYNPQTFFVDSLQNDPTGSAMLAQISNDAWKEFAATGKDPFDYKRDKGVMRGPSYRCLKNYGDRTITVWDSNMGDRYRYDIEMDDTEWELCDSTKNVLGYECSLASGTYHGRQWNVWFTPDIPVSDGPWQLHGLPGLIMEATSADGDYSFSATGLQACDEPLKDPFENDKFFKTKRISFLRMKDYSRRNRGSQVSAMTRGEVRLKENADYKGKDDFLETDYHE